VVGDLLGQVHDVEVLGRGQGLLGGRGRSRAARAARAGAAPAPAPTGALRAAHAGGVRGVMVWVEGTGGAVGELEVLLAVGWNRKVM